MRNRKDLLLYLALFLLFAGSLCLLKQGKKRKNAESISYHSNLLSSYAWDLNYKGIEEYLRFAVNLGGYTSAFYYDYASVQNVVMVQGEDLRGFESLLLNVGILQKEELVSVIRKNDESLGSLKIVTVDRIFYQYSFALLIYFLVQFILYLFLRLVNAKNDLNSRVEQRTLELSEEVSMRQRTEVDLRLTLDSIGDGVVSVDLQNRITRINPVACTLTGWPADQATGEFLDRVYLTGKDGEHVDAFDESLYTLASREGGVYSISESRAPIYSLKGELIGHVIVFRDVSLTRKLQNQLEHSQRMEAIGKLAGGIAHDFNNVLGAILGASELLEQSLDEDSEARIYNRMVIDTSDRAKGLTRQLLTFSRNQETMLAPLDFHRILKDTATLLKSTLDPRISISLSLHAEHHFLMGDHAMLENMLINLGVNSSHAMPGGGTISFATRFIEINEENRIPYRISLPPGGYLECDISDTGVGIAKHILPRIFEPFFTTKKNGEGTGLGLASVYGTIQQHHGDISVYSEENVGTSFRIYLPVSEDPESLEDDLSEDSLEGSGKIILADDQPVIRASVADLLEKLGYDVLTAENGKDALAAYERAPRVDLIILDVNMPEMSGIACFRALRELSSDLPVVLATGLPESDEMCRLKEEYEVPVIAKPYKKKELALMIKRFIPRTLPA